PSRRVHPRLIAVLGALAAVALPLARSETPRPAAPAPQPAVDFSRQVRPILSENCFACHGPDESQRKARLRLDTKEGAFGKLRHGGFALVPGKPAESRLLARITADDPSEVMPPPKTGKKLTPDQIALLKRWVEQGAKWSTHWAFTAPVRPALPKVHDAAWPRDPIDYFILARLEAAGLHPSPEADRETLLRRVTLDLTGLPPTPEEIDAFLADRSPDAYEKVVDRLLKSPRYGEHMARHWLDLARYGDTHGLHLDNYREIWPYRDWVIRAFNANMPYDQFITRQLAGDLLPNPTQDDLVATGFNRCHVSSSEGGAIEEEFYVRNTVDQVDTNGVVFLGLSTGCARCHDHKYDPIRQKDYYQIFALFNSIDGSGLDGNSAQWAPFLKAPSPEQAAALGRLDRQIADLHRALAEERAKVKYDDAQDARQGEVVRRQDYVWIDDALPPGAQAITDGKLNMPWDFVTAPDHPVRSGHRSLLRAGNGLSQMTFQDARPGLKVGEGDSLFAYVFLDPLDPPKELMLQWRVGEWTHRAYWGENVIPWGKDGTTERHRVGPLPVTGKWVRVEVEAAKVGLTPGAVIDGWAFTQHGGTVYWDRAGLETWTPQDGQPVDSLTAWVRRAKALRLAGLPKPVQDIIKVGRSKRTAGQKQQLRDYFLEYVYAPARPVFEPLHRQLAAAERERQQLDKQIPTTLVFKERPQPRPAYILKRGEYDQKGEQVGRDTPAFLPPLPPGAPHNRLGFARWLVMPEQPLTARVAVNRFWQRLFGTGIVKTSEDFGSQGEPPTHPELLDWMAVQFREDGWDMKRTLKRLVMSATYRQTSRATPERLAKDPANRLLSRGPRFRLDAEVIRDQALAVSGLLVERLGGPSVKPPQPEGLWEAVAYTASNTAHFVADRGCAKVHRRSMYTFWKRTAAPPQMTALDAPTREFCTVRRE
ncbi:MAG TPA: PSD1 and planctomycete cytochrome C domain-containing protein, partial [Gemmataceae bacterium]|nr:PSD1 and planctomycete cytochrome C domain-containing protein [Gemmataceae bacterium]